MIFFSFSDMLNDLSTAALILFMYASGMYPTIFILGLFSCGANPLLKVERGNVRTSIFIAALYEIYISLI